MRAPTAVLTFVLGVAACSGAPSAAECAAPAGRLVAVLQDYVGEFEGVEPKDFDSLKAKLPSPAGLAVAVARYRKDVTGSDCGTSALRTSLVRALSELRGRKLIAASIASSLRSSLTRAAEFGNEPQRTEEITVAPTDDLAAVVSSSVTGTRIVLAPGVHRVASPLVLIDGVTIVGAGRDRTRIVSRAEGVALIFLGSGTLQLEELALAHSGPAAASMIVVRAGSYALRNVRVSGARRGPSGAGGNGLIVGASAPEKGAGTRTMRIENSEFLDNDSSGITVGGDDAPLITRSVVRGSDVCGICYAGREGGVLHESRLTSNGVGVTVLSRARPVLQANTIAGNRIGVEVRDRARPRLERNVLRRNEAAAIVFLGASRGSTRSNSCEGGSLGIVLLGTSRPSLSGDRCGVVDRRS